MSASPFQGEPALKVKIHLLEQNVHREEQTRCKAPKPTTQPTSVFGLRDLPKRSTSSSAAVSLCDQTDSGGSRRGGWQVQEGDSSAFEVLRHRIFFSDFQIFFQSSQPNHLSGKLLSPWKPQPAQRLTHNATAHCICYRAVKGGGRRLTLSSLASKLINHVDHLFTSFAT